MFDATFFAGVLFSAMLTASGLSWLRWGLRPQQFGCPEPVPADPEESPPATETVNTSDVVSEPVERTPWPPMAIFAVLFWVAFMALEQTTVEVMALMKGKTPVPVVTPTLDKPVPPPTTNPPTSIDTSGIVGSMIMGSAVFVGLGLLLFASGRLRPEEVGIDAIDWPSQIAWGQQAFIASVVPTFVLLLCTVWFRQRETQHPFLQMLATAPDQVPLLMMFFIAAVVAPLSEELVFRVTLQGWLTERWHARGAIITTALIFAFVHGWRDGIALIPLALILGYLYHQRRSYLAVVTTHSLFNAANMAMALLYAMGSSSKSG